MTVSYKQELVPNNSRRKYPTSERTGYTIPVHSPTQNDKMASPAPNRIVKSSVVCLVVLKKKRFRSHRIDIRNNCNKIEQEKTYIIVLHIFSTIGNTVHRDSTSHYN